MTTASPLAYSSDRAVACRIRNFVANFTANSFRLWRSRVRSIAGVVLAVVLAGCVQVPTNVRDEIQLPPLFSDNMVLQQGVKNRLWGKTTPGKRVWVEFRGKVTTSRADRSGAWRVDLDCTDFVSSDSGHLAISIGIGTGKGARTAVIVLTNVVVGDVWIVGVPKDQGVPVKPRDGLPFSTNLMRSITVPELGTGDLSAVGTSSSWQLYGTASLPADEVNALGFWLAHQLSRRHYVGIVQSTPEGLTSALRPSYTLTAGRQKFLDEAVRIALRGAWDQVLGEVKRAQQIRNDTIVTNRGVGLPDPPPIIPYTSFPVVHLQEEFQPSKPPASLLSFQGAFW
jgi:hypothetical protein